MTRISSPAIVPRYSAAALANRRTCFAGISNKSAICFTDIPLARHFERFLGASSLPFAPSSAFFLSFFALQGPV